MDINLSLDVVFRQNEAIQHSRREKKGTWKKESGTGRKGGEALRGAGQVTVRHTAFTCVRDDNDDNKKSRTLTVYQHQQTS